METPKLTFEQAVRAKEKGFDAPCHYCFFQGKRHPIWQIEEIYTDPEYVLAPEVWLFLKWAYQKHGVYGWVEQNQSGKFHLCFRDGKAFFRDREKETPEEAEMKLVDEILNWIKP